MSDGQPGDACGCHADEKRAARDPAYRRALWMVIVLNLGFGVAEFAGGLIAKSQALKADSLDILGDGSITLVGLLALSWSEQMRGRVALMQGWFLALLGAGVIATAIWRALNAVAPDAALMGGLGIAALALNIAAALALARFRETGDASARAIWLNSAWPDLIVASVIALLFLHWAWEIIDDACAELRNSPMASRDRRL